MLPIMPALCSMPACTYYTSILGSGLDMAEWGGGGGGGGRGRGEFGELEYSSKGKTWS